MGGKSSLNFSFQILKTRRNYVILHYEPQEPLTGLSDKFLVTKNVSSSQMKSANTHTGMAQSFLQCAGQCLHKQSQEGTCNSFHLSGETCSLLYLTERTEKSIWSGSTEWPDSPVYVNNSVVEDTPLYCDGGHLLSCIA